MRTYILTLYAGILLAVSSLLFCSQLDDSTDLGSDIINGVYPDKVSIDEHFQEFFLDSAACLRKFSMPDTADTGFGIHNVTPTQSESNKVMVIGTRNGEEGFGFVRFVCPPDTDTVGRKRVFFGAQDTLSTVKLVFSRVTKGAPARFAVYSVKSRSDVLDNSPAGGGILLDTLLFATDSLKDSIVISHDSLGSAIFRACTSTVAASPGDTFSFALKNLDSDSLVRIDASPLLRVRANYRDIRDTAKPKDTFRIKNYGVTEAWYLVQESEPDSLKNQTISSYASLRTAVFAYDVRSLWKAMGDSGSLVSGLVSAGFVIRHPEKDTGALSVRYILTPEPVTSGQTLDTYFSVVSNTKLKDTARALYADVRSVLQSAAEGSRPSTIYLYLRLYCDWSATMAAQNKEQWQSVQWDEVPILKAIIHED